MVWLIVSNLQALSRLQMQMDHQIEKHEGMKMKTQKIWLGVAGVLVLGASVAAFGWHNGNQESKANRNASQAITSTMSMTDAAMMMTDGKMAMNSMSCSPETCGSSVCDGNTCDSPACSGTSCKPAVNMTEDMGQPIGMAMMPARDSMLRQMDMDKTMTPSMTPSMSPSMSDNAMAPTMKPESLIGQKM
jgi:hypothetical protein